MTLNTMQRQQVDATVKFYFDDFQETSAFLGLTALESVLDNAQWERSKNFLGDLNNSVQIMRNILAQEGVENPGALGLVRENRPGIDQEVNTTDVRVYVRERVEDHIIWAKIRWIAENKINILQRDKAALNDQVDQLTAEGLTKDEAIANLDKQIAKLKEEADKRVREEQAKADARIAEREQNLQVVVHNPANNQQIVNFVPDLEEGYSDNQLVSVMKQMANIVNNMRQDMQVIKLENTEIKQALVEVKKENDVVKAENVKLRSEVRSVRGDLNETKSTMNTHVKTFASRVSVAETKASQAESKVGHAERIARAAQAQAARAAAEAQAIKESQYSVMENIFIYGSAGAAATGAAIYGGPLIAAKVGAEVAAVATGAVGFFTGREVAKQAVNDGRESQKKSADRN